MFDQIIHRAEMLQRHVKVRFGYDKVTVEFSIKVGGVDNFTVVLDLTDDFQSSYDIDRVDCGSFYLSGDSLEELEKEIHEKLARLRGRATRELKYAMGKVSKVLEAKASFATAAGLDFVAALEADRARFVHLLEAPRQY